jgi:23S rRNA (guanosine2251-2'-O)-methyltransferase
MREWISGRNPVYETLQAGRRHFFRLIVAQGTQEKGRLAEILQIVEKRRIPIEQVQRARLDSISDGHQGVSLEASAYPYCALQDIQALAEQRSEPPFLLILDALQDPQNLGTLLRTAEGVGAHGVLIPLRHTATVTPAVVSASSGACEHLLIAQVNLAQAIHTIKDAGVWVVGLEGGPQTERFDRVRLDGPLALVVGSEGQGMRSLTRSLCDVLLHLPMRGRIESLNAAVAGSIALYLAWQACNFNAEQ